MRQSIQAGSAPQFSLIAVLARKTEYDMHCDCGQRSLDQTAEKDCEESARLEFANQAETLLASVNYVYSTLILQLKNSSQSVTLPPARCLPEL